MIRLTLAVLAALLVAVWLAYELEGALGAGVLAGYLLGAGLTGLSSLYQRHVLLYRPARALHASVVGFVVALAALLFGALAFRFIESAGARVDWRSFAIAFGAAVAFLLPLGAWEAVREQRQRAGAARAVRA